MIRSLAKQTSLPGISYWLVSLLLVFSGCRGKGPDFFREGDIDLSHYEKVADEVTFDIDQPASIAALETPEPRTLRQTDHSKTQYWDLSLQETVHNALRNSEVFRDIGGRVVTAPAGIVSVYDPAITETHGRFGVDAALGAFDAQWSSRFSYNENDRALNSPGVGGNPFLFNQEAAQVTTQLRKVAANGGIFNLRHNASYDANNQSGTFFRSAWNADVELEVRQPLLQGAGVDLNRIAGPNATPGLFFGNGVIIAQLNTDISKAAFETAVIRLVSDVEDAYWELSFAYRNLEAARAARDSALETWRRIHALYVVSRQGGEAENESQARQQYYQFEAAVQNALGGLATTSGVYASERALRRVAGLPITDARLIRPSDSPVVAEVIFDWHQILPEAISSRVELRRQKSTIRQREMELIAARNFLLPRLDAIGAYRFRGFGDDYLGSGSGNFGNAWQNLTNGDFQEWQIGMEFTVPLGFRQALSNMRNTQLRVARERAVLEEQEMQIAHDLSNAIAELDRGYVVMQTNTQRWAAAQDQVNAVQAAFDISRVTLDLLVVAQRRRAEAESAYYRSVADYNKAIKGVHFQKGSLLQYDGVQFAEAITPPQKNRIVPSTVDLPSYMNYTLSKPVRVTNVIDQALDITPSPESAKVPREEGALFGAPAPMGEISNQDTSNANLTNTNVDYQHERAESISWPGVREEAAFNADRQANKVELLPAVTGP